MNTKEWESMLCFTGSNQDSMSNTMHRLNCLKELICTDRSKAFVHQKVQPAEVR